MFVDQFLGPVVGCGRSLLEYLSAKYNSVQIITVMAKGEKEILGLAKPMCKDEERNERAFM